MQTPVACCPHMGMGLKSELIPRDFTTLEAGLKRYLWHCKLSSCRTFEWITGAPMAGKVPALAAVRFASMCVEAGQESVLIP